MASGVELIAAERQRQIEREGYTHAHDDEHTDGSIAMAAACYAAPDLIYTRELRANTVIFTDPWPWEPGHDKRQTRGNVILPNDDQSKAARVRQLVKAGALIAAEIDRLGRLIPAEAPK